MNLFKAKPGRWFLEQKWQLSIINVTIPGRYSLSGISLSDTRLWMDFLLVIINGADFKFTRMTSFDTCYNFTTIHIQYRDESKLYTFICTTLIMQCFMFVNSLNGTDWSMSLEVFVLEFFKSYEHPTVSVLGSMCCRKYFSKIWWWAVKVIRTFIRWISDLVCFWHIIDRIGINVQVFSNLIIWIILLWP